MKASPRKTKMMVSGLEGETPDSTKLTHVAYLGGGYWLARFCVQNLRNGFMGKKIEGDSNTA